MRTFEDVYNETLELLSEKFPNKKGREEYIVLPLILRYLTKLKIDISELSFLELYLKYSLKYDSIDAIDVPKSETKRLLEETKLSQEDEIIAKMKFLDNANDETIASKLGYDKKTIKSHIDKISERLKRTAYQLYKINVLHKELE